MPIDEELLVLLSFAVCGEDFSKIVSYNCHTKYKEASDMDVQKIGIFLKELRKQNNMTQEQLGERLGVTNKTVSRWETGNYLPPVECLKLLSDIYQISINEILAGKRLNENEYKEVSEENISVALEKIKSEEKRFENKMIVIMGITTALAIAIMFLLPSGSSLTTTEKIKEIGVVICVWAMAIISNSLNLVARVLRNESFHNTKNRR